MIEPDREDGPEVTDATPREPRFWAYIVAMLLISGITYGVVTGLLRLAGL